MATVSDYCLRFEGEGASFAVAQALDAVAMTEDGPRLVRFTHRYALDVIGELAGEVGWHVNLRVLDGSELPSDLAQYVVNPAQPARVWA